MRLRWALAFVLGGCSVELAVPDDAAIACDTDGDCPAGELCQTRLGQCVRTLAFDGDPPELVSVSVASPLALILTFNEKLDAASVDAGSYVAVPPIAITSVTASADGQTVVIGVEQQIDGLPYSLRVSGLADIAGNVIAAPHDSGVFTGVGAGVDRTPPEALVPFDSERIYGVATTTLRWSARSGATQYVIDVAFDSGFTLPMPGSPFVVHGAAGGVPPVQYDLPTSEARTYYWRVTADVSEHVGLAAVFDIIGDTIYVFCPAAVACSLDAGAGNASTPYQVIRRALDDAAVHGVRRVAIADRGGAPYEELVTLADGVSLVGGYGQDFSEASRLSGTYVTSIHYHGRNVVYGQDVSNLTVEGLSLLGGEADTVHTVELVRAANLIIRDCVITGGGPSTESITVDVDASQSTDHTPRVSLIGVDITASGVALFNAGVRGTNSSIAVLGSTIEVIDLVFGNPEQKSAGITITGDGDVRDTRVHVGIAYKVYAVEVSGGSLRFERNFVRTSGGFTVTGLSSSVVDAVVTSNDLDIGLADDKVTGAEITAPTGVVVNNTIGVKDSVTGGRVLVVDRLVVANNILYNRSSAGTPQCVEMVLNPLRFENNLYFGCPDVPAATTDGTPIDDLNECTTYPANGDQSVACAGNFTDAGAASFFANYAGSDLHLVGGAPAPVRLGGLDASAATYGNVTLDADRAQRSCTSAPVCYSLGAYEL